MIMVCAAIVKWCVHYDNVFCGLISSICIMIVVYVACKAVYMCIMIMVCREYKVVCAVRLVSWSVCGL